MQIQLVRCVLEMVFNFRTNGCIFNLTLECRKKFYNLEVEVYDKVQQKVRLDNADFLGNFYLF